MSLLAGAVEVSFLPPPCGQVNKASLCPARSKLLWLLRAPRRRRVSASLVGMVPEASLRWLNAPPPPGTAVPANRRGLSRHSVGASRFHPRRTGEGRQEHSSSLEGSGSLENK